MDGRDACVVAWGCSNRGRKAGVTRSADTVSQFWRPEVQTQEDSSSGSFWLPRGQSVEASLLTPSGLRHSLSCRWYFPVFFRLYMSVCMAEFPLLTKTPVILDQNPPWWPHLNLVINKEPTPSKVTSIAEGIRASGCFFKYNATPPGALITPLTLIPSDVCRCIGKLGKDFFFFYYCCLLLY